MALMPDYMHMAPVSHGTSACASSAFASPHLQPIKSVPWCLRILVWPVEAC